ncbi:amino acid ABC transporter permease [Phaeovulum vinaykumarii]|uniref:L-glutamine ABC transporter membrane protein /L-glutamate ABC transporter membrane protein /L-aspartate ABC transporter membrane protein /L-asparagine ABC transporter membrane protein n=1 Tax=Phaeovulum vinaykumarii TaxID=407234 RepID=A0A1N7L4Y7_9RHOB|nr:amino acid ABC transporter permease [Phaeovulum vinaykumarii]SIS68922.1 L-glutamine ABC transporter membrane protein /L-glutamate ABC transporter membrane protein /L-aspartate ABC transporter membrane protein /L-asparagine ABC transporter membrane protein [Phaeovulum vinaykumarii]SOB99773.1 L-glutamine ABC transporter membrane protein /L-glutamate ABC transporter membrane protein /L-aspartate ABC transporter membrane protein /L-asparagine ABC transporter membrane protein [Phaeovulum vinaykumar
MAEIAPFVRHEMLPAEPAPASEAGVLHWLRANLFSSPLNVVLTFAGVFIVYWLVSHSAPWLMHSVWAADSLGECRAIIAERWGPDATGACWAVIRDRWHQYLFGFYPWEHIWRPITVFALLFVAIAPVLFSSVPRKLLWFTLAYPLLALWLLWGGTIWPEVMIAAGFGIGALGFMLGARFGSLGAISLGTLAAALFWVVPAAPLEHALAAMLPIGLPEVSSDQFGGFLLAVTVGVGAIALSLPMGVLLALGRRSDMFLIRALCIGFIEFIRGVPLITLLFVASLLLNYFLPPGTNFDIILRVEILVTFFAAAYIAEVVRGALSALPRGQYEAADALGLDYWKAQRLIILPQALKISIPGIVSTFIGMFKDTTLVVFVGLFDPLKGISDFVRADFAWKGIYWEPYIFVGCIFFLFNFSMSRYAMYLEQKLKRDHR